MYIILSEEKHKSGLPQCITLNRTTLLVYASITTHLWTTWRHTIQISPPAGDKTGSSKECGT